MELWIRSQDKMKLVKVNCIVLEQYNKLIGYGNIAFELGSYETEIRALEILDRIQEFIEKKDINGNRYFAGEVYEMPER